MFCIWYNPKKNIYYHKFVRGLYYESYDSEIGAVNHYGHILVYVINNVKPYTFYTTSYKQRLVNKTISFLKKI